MSGVRTQVVLTLIIGFWLFIGLPVIVVYGIYDHIREVIDNQIDGTQCGKEASTPERDCWVPAATWSQRSAPG